MEVANVLDGTNDYLEPHFCMECKRHIMDTDDIDLPRLQMPTCT